MANMTENYRQELIEKVTHMTDEQCEKFTELIHAIIDNKELPDDSTIKEMLK